MNTLEIGILCWCLGSLGTAFVWTYLDSRPRDEEEELRGDIKALCEEYASKPLPPSLADRMWENIEPRLALTVEQTRKT